MCGCACMLRASQNAQNRSSPSIKTLHELRHWRVSSVELSLIDTKGIYKPPCQSTTGQRSSNPLKESPWQGSGLGQLWWSCETWTCRDRDNCEMDRVRCLSAFCLWCLSPTVDSPPYVIPVRLPRPAIVLSRLCAPLSLCPPLCLPCIVCLPCPRPSSSRVSPIPSLCSFPLGLRLSPWVAVCLSVSLSLIG